MIPSSMILYKIEILLKQSRKRGLLKIVLSLAKALFFCTKIGGVLESNYKKKKHCKTVLKLIKESVKCKV